MNKGEVMSIFKPIKDEFKKSFFKAFKLTFNLSRHGTIEPKDTMDQGHKSLAEDIFNTSCMTLNESGLMYPIFFLVKGSQFMPVVMPPETLSEYGVNGYASVVMSAADDQNAEAIMFISEQWQVKRSMSDEELKLFEDGKKLPSLDPDSQEVLCLIYTSSKGDTRVLMGEVQRSIDNTPFVRDSKWTSDQPQTSPLFEGWR
jgi:hypothetical protein